MSDVMLQLQWTLVSVPARSGNLCLYESARENLAYQIFDIPKCDRIPKTPTSNTFASGV